MCVINAQKASGRHQGRVPAPPQGQVLQAPALVQASAPALQPVGQASVLQDVLSQVALQPHELLQLTLESHELPVHARSQAPEPQVTSPSHELPAQVTWQSLELLQLTLPLHDAPEQFTSQGPVPHVTSLWQAPLLQVTSHAPPPQSTLSLQLPAPEQVRSQAPLPHVSLPWQVLLPVHEMSQAAPAQLMSLLQLLVPPQVI